MAMHCPDCLTEYRDGFVQCADCGTDLKPGPPPEPPKRKSQEHEVELATVFETFDQFALKLAKASLEDAGIPYIVNGGDRAFYPGMPLPSTGFFGNASRLTPLATHPFTIQVERESQQEAEELLEPLRNPEDR
jgi:hypothetical protein